MCTEKNVYNKNIRKERGIMKKTIKRIALILAASIILGVFASCANSSDGDTDREEEWGIGEWDGTRATTPDNLPEDLYFDGATISVLYRNGIELYEATGEAGTDIVYQAVYERNALVESRLGVKFEWCPTETGELSDTKNEMVQVLSSYNDDYDYILTTNNTILSAGMNSYLWDFNSAMYIDLTQPWWWMSCIEEMSFDGKTYNFLVGEMNLINFLKMSAFYFNSSHIKTYLGLDAADMYAKVDDGTWTLDELHRLVSKCYYDKNGNNVSDEGDLFGMPIAGPETINQLVFSTKFDIYKREKNGSIKILLENPRMYSVCDKLTKLMHENNGVYIQNKVDGVSGFDSFVIDDFTEGKYVFMAQRFTAVSSESMRQMDDDYGIIPYPTLEEGDEYVSYIQCSSTCVSVPYAVDEERFDRVCAVLEALSAEAYRTVTEKFYEYALKAKYVRDDYDSPRMIDIIYNSSTKYFLDEYNSNAGGIMNIMSNAIINKQSVTTAYAQSGSAAQNTINDFIAKCISAYRN